MDEPTPHRFGRAERIEDDHLGPVPEQAFLGALAEHDAGRHDHPQAGEVPSMGRRVEGAEDGFADGITDDDERGDVLALDRVEQLRRIECGGGEGHDGAALAKVAERSDEAGGVHERARREHHRRRLGERGHQVVERRHGRTRRGCGLGLAEVALLPHDSLRHAGGAPCVDHDDVVGAATPRRDHPR